MVLQASQTHEDIGTSIDPGTHTHVHTSSKEGRNNIEGRFSLIGSCLTQRPSYDRNFTDDVVSQARFTVYRMQSILNKHTRTALSPHLSSHRLANCT